MSPLARKLAALTLAALVAGGIYYRTRKNEVFFPRLTDKPPSPQSLEGRLKRADERLAKDPDDLQTVVDRGVVYFEMGPDHYADALNAFNAAWQAGVFDERIFYYSGILYENLSFFDEAQRQYERFLRHEPDDREIRLRLARLLFRMGKWDDAVARYQEFLQENDKDVTALINCGLAEQKKIELASGPKVRLSADDRAKLESERDQAISYLENAAKLQPDLPAGVYGALAKLQAAQGNWPGAAASCEAELRKSPDDAEILAILAQADEKTNQPQKALEAYGRLAQKKPTAALNRKIRALKKQLKVK